MLETLAPFTGTWVGEGRGGYPTVESFAYREELTFTNDGRPFLVYRCRAWLLPSDEPLHAEEGYWREQPGDAVELVLALSTGHTELSTGWVHDGTLSASSIAMAGTTTADDVSAIQRVYEVEGDVLRYTIDMQAMGKPLQWHLSAELRKQ